VLLPTITTVTPTTGSAGAVVTLTGTNFFEDDAALNISVLFQGVAVPVKVITVDTITAVVPVGTGTISVAILTDGRMSNQQQWQYAPPTISSLVPPSGPTIGSNLVTISGSTFGQDLSLVGVTFGSFGSCAIMQLTDAQIVCEAPPGIGANVSVIVRANQQASVPSLYTYSPPTLQSVYPSAIEVDTSGSAAGTITVTGQNLASSALDSSLTIQIGSSLCGSVTQESLATFACVPPSSVTGKSGTYPIKVIVAGQSSMNLTFRVFSETSQKPATTNNWWPLPWWIFVAVGGALVVLFAIGLLVGCKTAYRQGSNYQDKEREHLITHDEKRRSAIIN